MQYFTAWHFVVIGVLFACFMAGAFITYKQVQSLKIRVAAIAGSTLLCMILGFSLMILIDRNTKIAQVSGLAQQYNLINESIMFSGNVKNAGSRHITVCDMEISLVNPPATLEEVGAQKLDRSFFDVFLGKGDASTQTQTFTIAKHLKVGQSRHFSFIIHHPAYLKGPSVHYTLHCR